ncbi:MAG: cytochrome-c peroxidase [Anaerolineaceae bacterium]|nr:cytochrome-c peroxidase [Anaerolineaceae bacterium]
MGTFRKTSFGLAGGLITVGLLLLGASALLAQADSTDTALRQILAAQNITPLTVEADFSPELVALGQALFFDKELSGNRDISCATCHHPLLATGDGLSLSFGTGGNGLGPVRSMGSGRTLVPRNAPDVFNRGAAEWQFMFWDGRIALQTDGSILTPAGAQTPDGLMNIVAAQAIFPITSNDEMRGLSGDRDIYGHLNEIAAIQAGDFPGMWNAVMARVLAIPEYVKLFQAAYPDETTFDIQHLGNAIGAFEIQAFNFTNNPWNRYVAGDDSALSEEAKQGALLFFGDAGCSVCHSGALLSDQQFHNRVVPQLGPGKGIGAPFDYGRMLETGDGEDLFAFRTPSLYNVALTGPWMHNGALMTLEAAVRHELDPETGCATYDPAQLRVTFQPVVMNMDVEQLTLGVPVNRVSLSDAEVGYLVAFLESLTDPAALNLASTIPASVPSGLPLAD